MAIKISNLKKSYKDFNVLDNLNLTIPEGSIFGLLGPNGAGKTTLVSILNYLVKKDSGNIKIFDYDFIKDKNKIKQISSFIPQSYAFYPNLTAYENLEFFAALYGLKNAKLKKRIDFCIEVTSLELFRNKLAHTFSGGVKRRLNIAIGLLNEPKILYLDEPTVGIDPQSRKYILDVIKKINKEKNTTIIYTSHYMEEIEYLCDEIAILDNNKIVLQEKKDVLIAQNNTIEIIMQDKTISINTHINYNEFVDTLILLKESKEKIINIKSSNNRLEDMFLDITKGDLRD